MADGIVVIKPAPLHSTPILQVHAVILSLGRTVDRSCGGDCPKRMWFRKIISRKFRVYIKPDKFRGIAAAWLQRVFLIHAKCGDYTRKLRVFPTTRQDVQKEDRRIGTSPRPPETTKDPETQ